MKAALVSALCACAGERQKRKARRFLEGLSEDELRYIADFLGACILEAADGCASSSSQTAENMAAFERCRSGWEPRAPAAPGLRYNEHRLILLREYLSRCEAEGAPVPVRARRRPF